MQRDLGHASVDTTEAYLHDEHQAEHSASHELSPALHRGWLVSASLVERDRESQRGEVPGQLAAPLTDPEPGEY